MTFSRFRRVPAKCPAVAGRRLPFGALVRAIRHGVLGAGAFAAGTPVALILGVAAVAAEPLEPWFADKPPPLSLRSLDGRRVDLASVADGAVAVHFFATWCEPCRPEMASLEALRIAMGTRRFTILAVDVAEPEDRVRRFFETVRVGFPILLDTDKAALRAWNVTVLPTTFVLAPGGCGRWRVEGEHDWSAADTRDRLAALTPASASSSPAAEPAVPSCDPLPRSSAVNGDRP